MIHYYKASCHAENLKLIREFVKAVLRDFLLSETEVNQLVLAVDEVCTNIIMHSAHNNPYKMLEVHIIEENDHIEFRIIDQHSLPQDFNLTLYMRPSLQNIIEERRKGGIGLLLVRNIMDEVEIDREDCQNVWRLRKCFKNAPFSQPM
jgi:serine/threonine-protein kinase RsbW